jgi:hypothetical protein
LYISELENAQFWVFEKQIRIKELLDLVFFSKTSKGLMGFHERTGKELVIL